MDDSILNSTKKALGLDSEYDVFDSDVVMYINTVFGTLNQLGLGPIEGFMIEDATTTWDTFLGGDMRLNGVKTYTYLRVRMLFDPPTTAYLVSAMESQISEMEWRLNMVRESDLSVTIPTVTEGFDD